MGRRDDALKVAAELPATRVNTLNGAQIYAALGNEVEALRWIEAAYDQRHGQVPWIRNDPLLVPPLRDEPRFADFLRQMKLPS